MKAVSVTDTYTTTKAVDISVETAPVKTPVPVTIYMTTVVGSATVTEAQKDGKFKILEPGTYTIKVNISYSGASDETVFGLHFEKSDGTITKIDDTITISNFNHVYNTNTASIPANEPYSIDFKAGDLVYFTAGITKGLISVTPTITFSYSTSYSQSGDVTEAAGYILILPKSIKAPTVSGRFHVSIESTYNISDLTFYFSSPSSGLRAVISDSSALSIPIKLNAGDLPTIKFYGVSALNNKSYNAADLLKQTTDGKIKITIELSRLS